MAANIVFDNEMSVIVAFSTSTFNSAFLNISSSLGSAVAFTSIEIRPSASIIPRLTTDGSLSNTSAICPSNDSNKITESP